MAPACIKARDCLTAWKDLERDLGVSVRVGTREIIWGNLVRASVGFCRQSCLA